MRFLKILKILKICLAVALSVIKNSKNMLWRCAAAQFYSASAGGQSRPWEQRQRAQRDRSGIGAGKRVRFDADETQRKKPWFTHRGKDAAEQRAALKRDYEANLAEINAHERAERGTTPADTDTDVEHAETHDGMAAMLAAIEQDTKDPFCGMMIAQHGDSPHAPIAMIAQSEPHLLTVDSPTVALSSAEAEYTTACLPIN